MKRLLSRKAAELAYYRQGMRYRQGRHMIFIEEACEQITGPKNGGSASSPTAGWRRVSDLTLRANFALQSRRTVTLQLHEKRRPFERRFVKSKFFAVGIVSESDTSAANYFAASIAFCS
ncbi:MAG: hypothetical protein MI807_14435 [Verrucomicrobiales bacterium]|nr:hypothetical protein [Verrucomicrobiales bacterium]